MTSTDCFSVRVGYEKYRLPLLSLYPKVLHIRQILQRSAIVNAHTNEDVRASLRQIEVELESIWQSTLEVVGVLSNAFAPFPSENCTTETSKQYYLLWSRVDSEFFANNIPLLIEKIEKIFADLVKVNSDTRAKATLVNCPKSDSLSAKQKSDDNSVQTSSLVTSSTTSIETGIESSVEPGDVVDKQTVVSEGTSDDLKKLYNVTRKVESASTTLRQSVIQGIDLEGDYGNIFLSFPLTLRY